MDSNERDQKGRREDVYVQEFHQKREFTYCLLSVLTNFLIPIYWSLSDFDLVEYVRQNEELPSGVLVYIGCVELVKVILVLIMYPMSNVCPSNLKERRRASVELGGGGVFEDYEDNEENECGEIPKYDGVKIWEREETGFFSRRDNDEDEDDNDDSSFIRDRSRKRREANRVSWIFKVFEIMKGILAFVVAVAGGHALIVLLGAPVLVDKLLTLEFSFIVVTWLFLPLCIYVPPSTIISEVLFMRFWDINIEWVHRAQLRFIATLFGAWWGAIAFPLDWDRPWQRWPIPCIVSVFVFYTFFHAFALLYSIILLYGPRFKETVTFRSANKVKVY